MELGFKPQISFYEVKYRWGKWKEKSVESSNIYRLAKELLNEAFPSYENKFDKRWENFYLPVEREDKLISIPFQVVEYKKEFFVSFHLLGGLHIKEGNKEVEEIHEKIFQESLRFIPLLKNNAQLLKQTLPYDFRQGKIKGKYLLEKLLSKRERKRVWESYKKHLKRDLNIKEISLEGYLKVAGICYKAAFDKQAKNLSPKEMYKRWADGRDGGMLSIKEGKSKRVFRSWYKSKGWVGSHPFEIVFSGRSHGIHLYPPFSSPHYTLAITNYAYAWKYLEMVKELIKEGIPFKAPELKKVLQYLAGETYFTVNDYSKHNFFYFPCQEYKKLYFPHIEWDKIKVVKWK